MDMDDGARGWLIKTATKSFWRVSKWYELDDLIQDGYLCYYKVCQRYPTATDVPHRMALFKITYINFIHDLATRRTKSVTEVLDSDLQTGSDDLIDQSFIATLAECPLSGMIEVGAILASAPERVRAALELFTTEAGLKTLRSAYRRQRGGKHLVRETMNQRLCRVLGYDPEKVNLTRELRDFLTS